MSNEVKFSVEHLHQLKGNIVNNVVKTTKVRDNNQMAYMKAENEVTTLDSSMYDCMKKIVSPFTSKQDKHDNSSRLDSLSMSRIQKRSLMRPLESVIMLYTAIITESQGWLEQLEIMLSKEESEILNGSGMELYKKCTHSIDKMLSQMSRITTAL